MLILLEEVHSVPTYRIVDVHLEFAMTRALNLTEWVSDVQEMTLKFSR